MGLEIGPMQAAIRVLLTELERLDTMKSLPCVASVDPSSSTQKDVVRAMCARHFPRDPQYSSNMVFVSKAGLFMLHLNAKASTPLSILVRV